MYACIYACDFFKASVPDQQLNEQSHGQDTVTLQQGGQTVYPTHVQYVDSNDPALYASTNGQMYDLY